MVKAIIISLICICLFKCNYAQDSVLHFNKLAKDFLIYDIKPQWQDTLDYYQQDFQPFQLKDSTWFLDKQNLKIRAFQGIISQVQQTPWVDSILFEPINDTLYIR